MDGIIRDRAMPPGKSGCVGTETLPAPSPGNGLRREAEKTKVVSAFITRIYHHFDAKSSVEELDQQFLQSAIDLLAVDGAAILIRSDENGGFRARATRGQIDSMEEEILAEGIPRFGSLELAFRNSDSPADPVGDRLAESAGTPYFLWIRHIESSSALLLVREQEDPKSKPPFTDNSGHVAYSALQVYCDLLKKRSAHRESFESELRFQTMMENIPTGIFRIGRDGRIIRCNPALVKMLGYIEEAELDGQSIWDHHENQDEGRSLFEEILEHGAVIDREVRIKKYDGSFIWASTTVRAVRGQDGRVTSFDGSLMDIDHRKNMEQELHESYLTSTEALQGAVQAIMRMAEIRDPYTAGHQERVAQLARAIARELGVEENRAQGIYVAGILHDVGKIYVPAEILNKPGKITELEHNVLKTHVEVGYEILKPVRFPWPVAEIVHQHHERLDGSGYPRGLKEPEIILEARILSVADVVEAMLSHRPYRPGLGLEKALAEIERGSGTIYDASAVEACLHLFRDGIFKFRSG